MSSDSIAGNPDASSQEATSSSMQTQAIDEDKRPLWVGFCNSDSDAVFLKSLDGVLFRVDDFVLKANRYALYQSWLVQGFRS